MCTYVGYYLYSASDQTNRRRISTRGHPTASWQANRNAGQLSAGNARHHSLKNALPLCPKHRRNHPMGPVGRVPSNLGHREDQVHFCPLHISFCNCLSLFSPSTVRRLQCFRRPRCHGRSKVALGLSMFQQFSPILFFTVKKSI